MPFRAAQRGSMNAAVAAARAFIEVLAARRAEAEAILPAECAGGMYRRICSRTEA